MKGLEKGSRAAVGGVGRGVGHKEFRYFYGVHVAFERLDLNE